MITAKELNKCYRESKKVRHSNIIAKMCVDLLEKKLKETADSGFFQFHLTQEDGDELSDLFFKAEPHWNADAGEIVPCTDEADVNLVQRKVFEALIDAGFIAGWDGSPSRIAISWEFPNEARASRL